MSASDRAKSGGRDSPPPPKRMKRAPKKIDVSKYSEWTTEEVKTFFTERLKGREQPLEVLKEVLGLTREPKGEDLDKLTQERRDEYMAATEFEPKPAFDTVAYEMELWVKSLRQLQYMLIQDPVHGPIELHPLIAAIVNTPEFQRLRNIKQLGATYFVYPSATHTRFEHSIGVCHLAGELALALQRKQPELKITDTDVLCIQIAGLCHDLGHGPLSHVFEKFTVSKINNKWKHEKVSELIFQGVYKNLQGLFEHYGLNGCDRKFITEQIHMKDEATRSGRPKNKHFLYEIVANKRNGIDVDKWDYFARDCHHTGVPNNFQWRRCLHLVRAVKDRKGDWQLCVRDKEVNNIFGMFQTRLTLHRQVYSHKTTKIAEMMIADALYLVKGEKIFKSLDGSKVSIQSAVDDVLVRDDPESFLCLTDAVLQQIADYEPSEQSGSGMGQPVTADAKELISNSQNLLKRLHSKRQFYEFVGFVTLSTDSETEVMQQIRQDKERTLHEIAEQISKFRKFQAGNIIVEAIAFSYSSEKEKDKNPVGNVKFYTKSDPWTAGTPLQQQISELVLPLRFSEIEIRVYSKGPEKAKHEDARECFRKWKEEKSKDLGVCMLKEGEGLDSKYLAPSRSQDLTQ